jgi:hypothetical protein
MVSNTPKWKPLSLDGGSSALWHDQSSDPSFGYPGAGPFEGRTGRGPRGYPHTVIRAAYLRTYIPSEEVVGLPPHRVGTERRRLVATDAFIWDEPTDDDGIYTVWQGSQYVCPRNARLRMLEGVLAFTRTYPAMPLISEQERLAYASELSDLRRSSGHSRGYILSSAWHVPLRWFTAFHRTEKELYEWRGSPSIRYRTSLGEAIDRVHWAAGVLDSAGFTEQVVERVTDLETWLMAFHAGSMVELDYSDVAQTFPEGDLVLDESADDIRSSLLALEQGDFTASGEAYERIARRWADAQSYTFSN